MSSFQLDALEPSAFLAVYNSFARSFWLQSCDSEDNSGVCSAGGAAPGSIPTQEVKRSSKTGGRHSNVIASERSRKVRRQNASFPERCIHAAPKLGSWRVLRNSPRAIVEASAPPPALFFSRFQVPSVLPWPQAAFLSFCFWFFYLRVIASASGLSYIESTLPE